MKKQLLTPAQISKLDGYFIIQFEALGNDYQFQVSKEELLSELKTKRSKRPKKFLVRIYLSWFTIYITE